MSSERSNPVRILVPLDGSPLALQAIPFALALAGPTGTLVFTSIVPIPEAQRDQRGWALPMTEQDQDRITSRTSDYLREVEEEWVGGKKATHIVVSPGDPAEEILRIAAEEAVDLIVIASHSRGMLGRLRFGSVADRITRSSSIPVLVIRPQDGDPELEPRRFGRFIVALDGSERAEKAVSVVRRLARETGDGVHLLSVIPDFDVQAVPSPWLGHSVSTVDLGEVAIELERQMVDKLTRLADELNNEGVSTTFSVVTGDPFQVIDEVARHDDIIALTTHGRGGVERWALGSLAEKLVRHANAPVLIVSARSES